MDKQAPDEIDRLILELQDDRRDVRSRAAYELGKLSDPRILAPLIAALSDQDKFVRSWAAGALAKAGPQAVEPLLAVLDTAEPTVGYYAALALGELGDLRAVPLLAKALHDGDWDIRPSAAGALAGLGDPTTLPDRVLTEKEITGADRVKILASLRAVAYTDDQVQIRYSLPDVAEFCRQRSQSTEDSIRIGAIETLQAMSGAPVAADNPSLSISPESAEEPLPSSASPTTADAPAAVPAGSRPEAPETEKPKRSLWDRLTGR